jgi:hypothetical protein
MESMTIAGANPAKNHHTVPQFQLRRFARSNELVVHHRSGLVQTRTVKRTTTLEYFYDPKSGPGIDDRIEQWLSTRVENPAVDAMALLRRGSIPSGADHDDAATFLAYAMVRGPSFRRILDQLSQHGGPMMWAIESIAAYRKKHPEFDPSEVEYCTLVDALEQRAPNEVRHSGPAADLRTMVRQADQLAPRLKQATWTIAESPNRQLMISDTPVVAFHPLLGYAPGPQLWPDEFDLFVPITPKAVLIISEGAVLGPAMLTPQMAGIVNAGLAATAHNVVVRHPDMAWPADVTLSRARPKLPIPKRTITRNPDGHVPTKPEWPKLTSAIAQEGIALLGGDPPLNDVSDH